MKKRQIGMSICMAALLAAITGCGQKSGDNQSADPDHLSAWQAGYMDIHHISTGRGNAAFFILPDGTTMLVDAGDLGKGRGPQEIMKPVPNDSQTPAEWIARYVNHFSAPFAIIPTTAIPTRRSFSIRMLRTTESSWPIARQKVATWRDSRLAATSSSAC